MIVYKKIRNRHYFSLNNQDLADLAEVIWLLKHTPPPVGFHRKPFTPKQEAVIEQLYDRIGFPDNYASYINAKRGQ